MSGIGRPGPMGVSIGRAFPIQQGILNDDLSEAIEAIEAVHGDGDPPSVPIRTVDYGRDDRLRRRGRTVLDPDSGLPVVILIIPNETHRAFTTLHEIGHVLDLCGLTSESGFASSESRELASWREAVASSHAVADLHRLSALDSIDFIGNDGSIVSIDVDSRFAADLLLLEELWARSYAQYVTARSGNQILRSSLDSLRRRELDRVYYPIQWDDQEFEAIGEVIDTLFWRLGWRGL